MRAAYLWILAVSASALSMVFVSAEKKSAPSSPSEFEATASTLSSNNSGAAAGSISGTVKYGGQAPPKVKLPVTKDTDICGKHEHFDESLMVGAEGGIKGVIVSLKGVAAGKPLGALGTEFVIDQKGCLYSPHVSIAPVKTPIKFLNPDGVLHNVHSYSSKNKEFNKSQPKFLREMKVTYDQPELITLKCDVHGWMSAKLLIVDHPYYVVTDENGKFTLADVPPGTYTMEFWQEKLGTQSMQVAVKSEASTVVDHTFASGK